MLLKINDRNLRDVLKRAALILDNSGVVAYPTETFYGLAVKFNDEDALMKLYELKGRPKNKPLPLIVGSEKLINTVAASLNNIESALAEKFWPGPLTLLLNAKAGLSKFIVSDNGKVALRIPGESLAFSLAKELAYPIIATSANPSGKTPPQDANTVRKYFNDKLDLIIDGGKTKGGLPSTIVSATESSIEILRAGVVDEKTLLEFAKKINVKLINKSSKS
jgi:L-threonylcarbamoyladenylate synthase